LFDLKYKQTNRNREKALEELASLSKEFTEVAHESPTLTHKIFDAAEKNFYGRTEEGTQILIHMTQHQTRILDEPTRFLG
jgi:hypothetical protein